MKKFKFKAIGSVILFIVIFCMLFQWTENILRHKVKEVDAIYNFYQQPKDTIDVLLLGSSHTFLSMSPMELWQKEGISSYNLGTPSQTVSNTYFLLKDAIKKQHPKVAVLETYGAIYASDFSNISRLHMVTDCMPLSKAKIEMFREIVQPNLSKSEQLEILIPMIRYHSRWDSLESEDFFSQKKYLRGYKANYQYRKQKEPALVTDTQDITENAEKYFREIVELCKEEGVELLVCRVPMGGDKAYASRSGKMNTVLKLAEELNVPTIDFEILRKEINLDYGYDFLDQQHLNASGAIKVSAYLTDYLKENYDLPDHRDDNKYKVWIEDAEKYENSVTNGMESMTELVDEADDEAEDEK